MNERDIFLSAIEIADPIERTAYIEQTCAGNAELRSQVEELLKTHEQTSQFLETPAVATDSVVDRTVLTDSSGTDDDPGGERTSGEEEFRKYLEPATRPGWLGRLAHYEIEEILGRGAFGIVAKAFDEKLHRVVAIKLMNPELATTSPPRKRFLREARTAAAVTNENIVSIHAVEEEPIPYLVMEYIPGQTLQQRMDEHGPLEVPDVLRIGQEVAAGLAAAHAVNLIHRDIKPSNILLSDTPNMRAKISDFGLARAVDDATMTSSGLIAGTPMYMAPEQARGETLDHRADLFSLGSVLYQMTGGRPPFRAANTVAVLKRVCEDTPRPLDDVLPGTPGWLETIIFKLLEKDRNDRYQTAQEVADVLQCCQRELEHNGQVTCVEGRSGSDRTEVFQSTTSTSTHARKKPMGWLVGGVIAVAAVIGIALMYGGKQNTDPDPTSSSGNTTSGNSANPIGPESPSENWALEFDGIDDFVDLQTLKYDGSYPLTVELWTRTPQQAFPSYPFPFFHNSSRKFPTQGFDLMCWPSGNIGFKLGYSIKELPEMAASWPQQPAGDLLPNGCYIAAIFHDDRWTLYINGKKCAKQHRYPMKNAGSPLSFLMGVYPDVDHSREVDSFHLLIDEIRVSNIARYSEDYTPANRLENDEHTLALYHFDEGQGDVLNDSSGNGHHGKIIGAKWVRLGIPSTSTREEFDWADVWPADAPPPAIAPFNAEQAKAHQEAWAQYLGVPVEHENSIGMKFRLIPPGEFIMGSTPEEIEAALEVASEDQIWRENISSEGPQHKVILTQPVYVGVTEVTQAQYEQVMGVNPSHFSATGEGRDLVANLETGNHPVEMVSWNDAAEFCAKLSVQEKLKPFYLRSGEWVTPLDGTGYRLPTEAEWEHFCRAGTASRFWSGNEDDDLPQAGWFDINSGDRTHSAGELKANLFGLLDVHGNVWEWVQDSWDPAFYGKFDEDAAIDPSSPFTTSSKRRVFRGGGWKNTSSDCRSSARFKSLPTHRGRPIGFRVALPVDAVQKRPSAPP